LEAFKGFLFYFPDLAGFQADHGDGKGKIMSNKTPLRKEHADPLPGIGGASDAVKPSGAALSRLLGALFYLSLAVALLLIYLVSGAGEGPRSLFAFSTFTVLTDSMWPDIPRDSFVLVRQVDPADIEIGNDVTYLRADGSTVTHRVVGIEENYDGSGMRGFQTQGIRNPQPDSAIVFADNVVGKVVFHNAELGALAGYLKERPWPAAALAVLLMGLLIALRKAFASRKAPASESRKPLEGQPPSGS
jgi:signal peptidase